MGFHYILNPPSNSYIDKKINYMVKENSVYTIDSKTRMYQE